MNTNGGNRSVSAKSFKYINYNAPRTTLFGKLPEQYQSLILEEANLQMHAYRESETYKEWAQQPGYEEALVKKYCQFYAYKYSKSNQDAFQVFEDIRNKKNIDKKLFISPENKRLHHQIEISYRAQRIDQAGRKNSEKLAKLQLIALRKKSGTMEIN